MNMEMVLMKGFKLKKILSLVICSIAMFFAATSTTMCWVFFFGEPEMPKSLYEK
jgi:hypothetical protein